MKAQTFEWIAENEDESRQNGTKRGHVIEYNLLCTKEQYIHEQMKKMAEIFYGNSFGRFASAFIGERKVSKEELKKLRGRGMSRQGLK